MDDKRLAQRLDRIEREISRTRGPGPGGSPLLGLAFGAILGAIAAYFLDPALGRSRRALLGSRAVGVRNDVARTTAGRVEDVTSRLSGFASENDLPGIPREDSENDDTRTVA